jgi:PASTA domain-containing protein
LLVTAGLTSAASNQQAAPAAAAQAASATNVASLPTLVVPKVRGQVYVFAKGILEDSGFAWKVEGAVDGFAANLVADQRPAPGTKLVDTGAPTITLRLERNAKYAEDGVPENFSPFAGTRVLQPAAANRPAAKPAARPKKSSRPAVKRPKAVAKTPATKRPKAAAKKPAATRPKTTPKAARPKSKPQVTKTAARPAAFTVPGAPKEPLNEMPLPRRARLLETWVTNHPRPTDANVAHWLYQHAWIVTGAKFGWWRGAEALRILIAVDGRAVSNWGIGTRSRTAARAALAEVEAKGR